MVKQFLIAIVCFLTYSAIAQNRPDYSYTDEFALKIDADNAIDLAWRLEGPFVTNTEKVRAFYRWITDNVAYDVMNYKNEKIYEDINYPNLYIDNDLNDSVYSHLIADFVIRKKLAICDGYARLFKTLCDYSNIPCKIIHGYADNGPHEGLNDTIANHAWNAVYLNKKWQLIDVTWASGYCDNSIKIFTKRLDDKYYLANPVIFVKNHFPAKREWSLIQ